MGAIDDQKGVHEDLKKDGLPINVKVTTHGVYDEVEDSFIGDVPVVIPTYGLIKKKTHKSIANGHLVSVSEKTILVSGYLLSDLSEKDSVSVEINDKWYDVERFDAVQPAGIAILYKLVLK